MELREGFKKTDVGIIPEEWNVFELRSLLKSTQLGGNYRNSEVLTNFPLIKMGNIGRGNIKLNKLEYIHSSQTPLSRDRLFLNDVLFNTRNTLDLVGKVAIWKNELANAFFNSNLMRLKFFEELISSDQFMNFMFNTPRCIAELRGIAIGTTSVAAIYNRDLLQIKFPVPPQKEQTAIANALSDADALIGSLQKLISKKRQIKQGAMQTLLNPYENGVLKAGWTVKRLGEVANLYQPETISAKRFTESGYPVYGANGVIGHYHTANHRTWQVTVTCRGSTCGTVNKTVDECWITGNAMVLNCDEKTNICKNFFYYLLLNKDLTDCITGTGQPQIVRSPLAAVSISFPEDLYEQMAIAEVFSNMDTEIVALETKLAKYQKIKQGMMQNLLTGRIRLV